jgi:hypothetical protein
MNIDCEIYIKNFVTFFNNNPNDLRNLIGDVQKDIFYGKVRDMVHKKCDEGEEYILTQQELLKILVDIHNQYSKPKDPEPYVQMTNFGPLFLN